MYYMLKDILISVTTALPVGIPFAIIVAIIPSLIKCKSFENIKTNCKIYIFKIFFWLYTYILINRTIISREPTYDSLSNVFGGWKIYIRPYTGINYEAAFGNILVFVPFAFFMLFAFEGLGKKIITALISGTFISLSLSLLIEITQLITHRGTFQLSDLVFNALGGLIGAIFFIIIKYITQKRKTQH